MMKLPNLLTLLRIVLVPLLLVMFYLPYQWAAMATVLIFVIAGVTDWLDGYLARSLQQTSALGAFLDPVADKLIVVIALVFIVGEHSFPLVAIPAAIIISREILISALREWMAEIGKRASIAVSYIGKVKTFLQMSSIMMMLVSRIDGAKIYHHIGLIGYLCLYIAATLTLWSMFLYIKAAWCDLKSAA